MSHYQLYSKYVACPANSLVTSLKKSRKMVIGVKSLFTWVASNIFSTLSQEKGLVPPEFQVSFICLPNSILDSNFIITIACCYCVFIKLTFTTILYCFAIQYQLLFIMHFTHKNLHHCDKEKLYSLEIDTSCLVSPG